MSTPLHDYATMELCDNSTLLVWPRRQSIVDGVNSRFLLFYLITEELCWRGSGVSESNSVASVITSDNSSFDGETMAWEQECVKTSPLSELPRQEARHRSNKVDGVNSDYIRPLT